MLRELLVPPTDASRSWATDARHLAPEAALVPHGPRIDWIVVGGESGPGARPFDVAWARQAVAQCKAARVPCFVKQLGARPVCSAFPLPVHQSAESIAAHGEYDPDAEVLRLKSRKGSDPSEWPADLRVREVPACG